MRWPSSQRIPPHLKGPIERAERLHTDYVERAQQKLSRAASRSPRAFRAERRRLARFASNIVRAPALHSEPSLFTIRASPTRVPRSGELPWLGTFEAATLEIRGEFERLMASERAELVPYIQYSDDQPLRQWKALNWNKDWTAVHLVQNGARIEANARHCPRTMALLEEAGQPKISGRSPNAMFSLLAPGAHIPPHNGVANTRLVCHLPLIVPPGCWFRVGDDRREWEVGKAWIFDDTIEHEAMNPSDALRVS